MCVLNRRLYPIILELNNKKDSHFFHLTAKKLNRESYRNFYFCSFMLFLKRQDENKVKCVAR